MTRGNLYGDSWRRRTDDRLTSCFQTRRDGDGDERAASRARSEPSLGRRSSAATMTSTISWCGRRDRSPACTLPQSLTLGLGVIDVSDPAVEPTKVIG